MTGGTDSTILCQPLEDLEKGPLEPVLGESRLIGDHTKPLSLGGKVDLSYAFSFR